MRKRVWFMKVKSAENEILEEIAEFCEECPSHENCPEEACVLYNIERKIISVHDNRKNKKKLYNENNDDE